MFEQLNRNSNAVLKENVKLEDMNFIKLREFIGKEITVDGFFFTNGEYGEQVVIVSGTHKINMPARAVEQFKAISESEEMRNAVLEGHLAITAIKELKGKRGKYIAYTLVDR